MIYTYIVLYSHSNYIFQLNINTLDIKILYNLRGFTVQVTYICQNYLGFHTVSFENYHGGLWNYWRGFLHIWPIFEQWFCPVQFCNLPRKSSERWVTERACSTAIVQHRAVSCIIVQNRSLLEKIGKNNWLVFWKVQRNVVTLHQISDGDTGLAKPLTP